MKTMVSSGKGRGQNSGISMMEHHRQFLLQKFFLAEEGLTLLYWKIRKEK